MSHTVQVNLIADQEINLIGHIVNIHDLTVIHLDGNGVVCGYSTDEHTKLRAAPGQTAGAELLTAVGHVLDDAKGQGLAPGGTSAVRDVNLIALNVAYGKATLPTPNNADDPYCPTANQIKWLRDCNVAGYDPVLEIQKLRDKVALGVAAPTPPAPEQGWRLLDVGEYIREGDEIFTDTSWVPVDESIGENVEASDVKYGFIFRRRIAAPTPAPPDFGKKEEL